MKLILIVLAVVVLLCVAMYWLLASMYNKSFGKHSEPNARRYTYGYDFYSQKYPRREVVFSGKAAELHAFVYGEYNNKALVVFAHGIGSQHEDYLSTIIWLVDHGYRVFAPDLSGSGASTGSTTGLSQSAIDMDTVLSYIEADPQLKLLPKVLMGHSWGSYGVGAVLNYDHDVKAVVNVAGYNDPVEMISFMFVMMMGKFGNIVKPFLKLHHLINFGKQGLYRVVDGINKANIPVLLIQGSEDPINTPDGTSIYAYKERITNPYVEYLYITRKNCSSHDSVFRTDEANDALAQMNDQSNSESNITKEMLEQYLDEFYAKVDKGLMSEPNTDVLEMIDSFFQRSI